MLLTVAITIVVLGVLIFVHELGHFLAAKAVGIGVPRFSIGFGPPTPLRFQRGETEYVVAWVPLGGYVKMASREEQEAMGSLEGGTTEDHWPESKLFENKPLLARIVVISAGVIMNFLFAWVVYVLLATGGRLETPTTTIAEADSAILPPGTEVLATLPYGTEITRINGDSVHSLTEVYRAIVDPGSERLRFDFRDRSDPVILPIPGTDAASRAAILDAIEFWMEPRVGSVLPGEPAERAGLEPGDLIVGANGDTIRSWQDLLTTVEGNVGDTVMFLVLREGEIVRVPVVPAERSELDPATGEVRKVGRIGVGQHVIRVEYSIAEAVVVGSRDTWDRMRLVLITLKGMVLGQISPRDLGGPILIGQMSGQVARLGFVQLVAFMAFLSLNLAILNLLPIPVLDGGHLVFLFAEGIRGKPLSLAVRVRLTQVGLLVLMGIMALVLTNDLFRLIGG